MSNYVKPAISLQLLNTTTGVSDGCKMTATQAQYACPVDIPGLNGETVFPDISMCTYRPGDVNFEVCYQGPGGIVSVMGS